MLSHSTQAKSVAECNTILGTGQPSSWGQKAENTDFGQDISTLQSMFPDLDFAVLHSVLKDHNYDQDRAAETLLAAAEQLEGQSLAPNVCS
jgi:hypothetical protein